MRGRSIHNLSILCVALVAATAVPGTSSASGAPTSARLPAVEDELLVKLHPGAGCEDLLGMADVRAESSNALSRRTIKADQDNPLTRVCRLRLQKGTDRRSALPALEASPEVAAVQPNFLVKLATMPSDPEFDLQWHLHNTGALYGAEEDADIDAPEAWDLTTGDSQVVVAIMDTGLERDHPELEAAVWTNRAEIPDNEVDDDGNGYVDDVWGWDFVTVDESRVDEDEDPAPPDNDPSDFHGHGTQVAGLVTASANNGIGGTGVTWECRLMGIRTAFATPDGDGRAQVSDLAQAIVYAVDNGAAVINMSLGGSVGIAKTDWLLGDALAYAREHGVVLVAAAGNDNLENNVYYPASDPSVVGVVATDASDRKAGFSNYGPAADISAPGSVVYTTTIGGENTVGSGTSFASPVVAGVAALVASANPGWRGGAIAGQVVNTADDISDHDPGYAGLLGKGRVNALQALTQAPQKIVELNDFRFSEQMGNGDGILDPGENGTLTLWLRNDWAPLGDLTLTLEAVTAGATVITPEITLSGGVDGFSDFENVAGDQHQVSWSGWLTPGDTVDLQLTVEDQDSSFTFDVSEHVQLISLDDWQTTGFAAGTPIAGDVDGDGDFEVAVREDDTMHLLNSDGSEMPGWPLVAFPGDWNGYSWPALGDLDGDGDLEIVLAGGSSGSLVFPKVYAWNHDGTSLPGWPFELGVSSGTGNIKFPPRLADLDGDALPEVVVVTSEWVSALDLTGDVLPGWPVDFPEGTATWSVPSCGDITGDGIPEVIIGTCFPGFLHALDSSGQELAGWPVPVNQGPVALPPVIADLEGDGSAEIVVPSQWQYNQPTMVYVLESDGSIREGWPAELPVNYAPSGGPLVADLDSDGILEIVLPWSNGEVHALHADGTPVDGWPRGVAGSPMTALFSDVFADGLGDVLAVTDAEVHAVSTDLTTPPGFPLTGRGAARGASFADLTGDGAAELLLGGNRVWALDSRADLSAASSWPTPHHDMWGTGCAGFVISNSNTPPTASQSVDFSWSPQEALRGEPIDFTVSESPSGARYHWHFSDGHTATGQAVSHRFATLGAHSVVLTMTWGRGSVSRRHQIEVHRNPVRRGGARVSP